MADAFPPFGGRCSGTWGSEDEAVDVVGQSSEIKSTHVSVGRQDDPGTNLGGFGAWRVAEVGSGQGTEVERCVFPNVAWAKQNARGAQFVGDN